MPSICTRLPADRDVEVTSSDWMVRNLGCFDEAENRLHAQKAVMALTMCIGEHHDKTKLAVIAIGGNSLIKDEKHIIC